MPTPRRKSPVKSRKKSKSLSSTLSVSPSRTLSLTQSSTITDSDGDSLPSIFLSQQEYWAKILKAKKRANPVIDLTNLTVWNESITVKSLFYSGLMEVLYNFYYINRHNIKCEIVTGDYKFTSLLYKQRSTEYMVGYDK